MKIATVCSVSLCLFILNLSVSENGAWRRRRRRRRSCGPTNCHVSNWSSYTACSASCGHSGTQRRTRYVVRGASCGGGCPYGLSEVRPCNRKCCPVNCIVPPWPAYSSCSASCGSSGIQTRTRTKTRTESCGGICPYGLRETTPCNRKCCPVNCVVSSWTSYGSCSASCGTSGIQTRTRTKTSAESCGGTCPALSETKACNRKCCPVNCVVSSWTSYGSCSASCGTSGIQTRTRTKTSAESCGGTCPALSETKACNRKCCPVNCLQTWTAWSSCNCNRRRSRSLKTIRKPSCGGKSCTRGKVQYRRCQNPKACRFGWCAWRRGVCICRSGYRGSTCSLPCQRGTFGRNCSQRCRCARGTCLKRSGKCICPIGYIGKRCHIKFKCSDRYFKCKRPRNAFYRNRNCIIRYSSRSNLVKCPHPTHRSWSCPRRRGCRVRRLRRNKGCRFFCRQCARTVSAICCPLRRHAP